MRAAIVIVAGLLAGLAGLWAWRRVRRAQLQSRCRQADLDLQRAGDELAEAFRAAAEGTGSPRGLSWKSVALGEPRIVAVERGTLAIHGLVAVEIRFEAIPGGGMEEVEAVSNVRAATAVFVYRGASWTTAGRTVFNLSPLQTLQRFAETLTPADEFFAR